MQSENASADNSPLRVRKPFGYKGQPSQQSAALTTKSVSSGFIGLNSSNDSNNFKVVVRVRPPLPREMLADGTSFCSVVQVNNAGRDQVS